tara:strand:+ start:59 stop:292 length:234 start_codon:yes stop_codon:yes gene_type:complete
LKQFTIIESNSTNGTIEEFLVKSFFKNFMKKFEIINVKYAEKIVDMKPNIRVKLRTVSIPNPLNKTDGIRKLFHIGG